MTPPFYEAMRYPQKGGVVAIVPSAGFGKRLGLKVKKPFVRLGGKPLVAHALKTLNDAKSIDAIVIAAEKACVRQFNELVRRYEFDKVIGVVVGGKTRFGSVRNCLAKIGNAFDIVLIHDGARPFVEESVIKESIRIARKSGACVVAVPESDTVKLVGKDLVIKKTFDRNRIYRAQTPQVFKRALIKKAYAQKAGHQMTDDASLVEMLGRPVKILEGSYANMKITTKEDLKFAEVLL